MTYIPSNKLAEYRERNKPGDGICPILGHLVEKGGWAVDHDHRTGMIRGVISREANTLIGKIENHLNTFCYRSKHPAENVLDRIIIYLVTHIQEDLHPKGAKQLASSFSKMKRKDQRRLLAGLGLDAWSYKNSSERTSAYLKAIKEQ